MCSFLVWKNACLNYREFDLEGDLVGVPHTWYLSAQSFIWLLKIVWRQQGIVAMNEWKKKCVGLQRTWVSERTVSFEWFLEPFLQKKKAHINVKPRLLMSIDFRVHGMFTCCYTTGLALIKAVESVFMHFLHQRTIKFNTFCAFKTLNFQGWLKDEKVTIINNNWHLLLFVMRN